MIEVLSLAGQEYLGVVVVVDGERNAMDLAEVKKFDGGETADSAGSWHSTNLILQRELATSRETHRKDFASV